MTMRHYEVVFLAHPDQSEQVPAMIDRYRSLIEEGGGVIHRLEDWGRRQLAYPIDKVYKAHYVLMNIECGQETLEQLNSAFRFNDAIIRDLIFRKNQAETEPSLLAKSKEQEDEGYGARKAAQAAEPGAEEQPAPAPVSEDAAEPDAETVAETDAEAVAEPETGDAVGAGAEDAAEPGAGDAAEPGAVDAAEPGAEDAAEPGAGDAGEPEAGDAAEPEAEDAAKPSTELAADPAPAAEDDNAAGAENTAAPASPEAGEEGEGEDEKKPA